MTTEQLTPLLVTALAELDQDGRARLKTAIETCEIDVAACCAAKVVLNGESPYLLYARKQLAQMIVAKRQLIAQGVPRERLTFGGPLVETMIEQGMDVPGLWIIECAYEGWFAGMPRSESEGLLKQLVSEG